MFLFTDAIVNDRPIKVFNHGNIDRAFTYIVDIVEGVVRIIEKSPDKNDDDRRDDEWSCRCRCMPGGKRLRAGSSPER